MLNSDSILGLIVWALQLALSILLVRQKFYRLFPFFCVYTASSIAASALRFWTINSPHTYFLLFWITEAILSVLELLALQEAFKPSLMMDYEQHPWMRLVAPGVIVGIFAYALYRGVYHPVGRGPLVRLAAGAYAFEVGVRVLEVSIFLLTLKLARRRYHPVGQRYPYGIVVGLGIAASAALLADMVGLQFAFRFGHAFESFFRYLPGGAYMGATIGWLYTFAKPDPPRPRATPAEVQRRLDEQKRILDWIRKDGCLQSSSLHA